MPLYRIGHPLPTLDRPVVLAAFDGWVDAGTAATAALKVIAEGAAVIATFDADSLYDFRSRRPTLDIRDGCPASLDWPELTLRHVRHGNRDLLILGGAEPDFRWHALCSGIPELLGRLGTTEWISLGAIPAAVPHARSVPILGTESEPGRHLGHQSKMP